MASDHPFQLLFETLGRPSPFNAELVNRRAYEILAEILTVPLEKTGRCILLRAPRAGHGKTHLLSRVQHFLGSAHEFIPLHPAFGSRINSVSVTDDVLRRLVRPLPASGGLCVLDLFTRRLFASALQPLVGSGEVPCQDREGALSALRMRPVETFDFHHANAVTAHWARENFEVLGQRLSLELAGRCGLPVREISFWVDALFRFAATPVESPSRVRTLVENAHLGNADEGMAMERLEALLGLLSQLTRVVLVADDLEGFSADETAALRFAAFLGSLRQSVERLDVILSLNVDIWESAFLPRLSGGLADRLSEIVVELAPLTEVEMAALLDSRVPGLGGRVLEHVDRAESGTHARGLIRAAGMAWLRASAQDSQAVGPKPAEIPLPVAVAPAAAFVEPEVLAPQEVPLESGGQEAPAVIDGPSIFGEAMTPASVPEASAPPIQEDPTTWPSPQFNQPPEVAPVFQSSQEFPAYSPYQAVATDPVTAEPQIFNPPPSQPMVEEPAFVAPEPVFEAPARIDSPFQIAVEPAPPAYDPASQSGFSASDFQSPSAMNSPFQPAEFQTTNPIQSPFFPSQTFNPPPSEIHQPAPEFNPPALVPQPTTGFYPVPDENLRAPIQSPFQIAEPAVKLEVPNQNFPAARSQNFSPQVAPPFSEPAPPAAQPAFDSASASSEHDPSSSSSESDRVDDLLRQFRDRYGRGSL